MTQLAEHAAAYLAQFNRQREDDAGAVADLLSGDADAVRRSAIWIADRGLIARRTPVVAVVVGGWTLANPVRRPDAQSLGAAPDGAGRLRPNSTALVVPLRDIRRSRTAQVAAVNSP